jgi:hypothetical protein
VFERYGDGYRQNHSLEPQKAKTFQAITNCRKSILGAHVDICDECGHIEISYNSCRNRHCPRCQTFTKERWLEARRQDLLDIDYFHVVFTVPEELNSPMLQNQTVLYNLFFKAVSETIAELCQDPKYLGATPGITAILHTWGQNLSYHPHIHCVVTGGGMTDSGFWRPSRKKFFLPIKVLSAKFRGKFLAYLKQAKLEFYGSAVSLTGDVAFKDFIDVLYKKNWVTYCKTPFKGVGQVLDYLGRYTHRVAISDSRILSDDEGKVKFKWRDYKDNNKQKVMNLSSEEFIRRFLLHVLPAGFRKIRHFGLMAPRNKTKRLSRCRKLTSTKEPSPPLETLQLFEKMMGPDWNLCHECKVGHLSRAAPHLHN